MKRLFFRSYLLTSKSSIFFYLKLFPAIRCIFCVAASVSLHPPHKRMSLLSGLEFGQTIIFIAIDSFPELCFISLCLFETSCNCILFLANCLRLSSTVFCFLQFVGNFLRSHFVSHDLFETSVNCVLFPAVCLESNNFYFCSKQAVKILKDLFWIRCTKKPHRL